MTTLSSPNVRDALFRSLENTRQTSRVSYKESSATKKEEGRNQIYRLQEAIEKEDQREWENLHGKVDSLRKMLNTVLTEHCTQTHLKKLSEDMMQSLASDRAFHNEHYTTMSHAMDKLQTNRESTMAMESVHEQALAEQQKQIVSMEATIKELTAKNDAHILQEERIITLEERIQELNERYDQSVAKNATSDAALRMMKTRLQAAEHQLILTDEDEIPTIENEEDVFCDHITPPSTPKKLPRNASIAARCNMTHLLEEYPYPRKMKKHRAF